MECEECNKKLKRKEGIEIVINGKKIPFIVCSWECLSLYASEVSSHEENGNEP